MGHHRFHADCELANNLESVGVGIKFNPRFVLGCAPLGNFMIVLNGACVDLGNEVGGQCIKFLRGGCVVA